MGKWFRNGNLFSLLIGALGAGLTAAYEYWADKEFRNWRKKGERKPTKKRVKKTKKK